MFRRIDPLNSGSTKARISRSMDELVGLCNGILSDGMVVPAEAAFLRRWLEAHAVTTTVPEVATLVDRLASALQDGVLDADEESDLLAAISSIAMPGASPMHVVPREERPAPVESVAEVARLPFDDPANFDLQGACVVVSGVFEIGTRADVLRIIESCGGKVTSAVNARTDYVIVGKHGSGDWLSSSGGVKIRAAIDGRKVGFPTRLISEVHMLAAVDRMKHWSGG